MAAAKAGHLQICNILLEAGVPCNAIDRKGKCAGNYATEYEHWEIVNVLVDPGTISELRLGAVARKAMKGEKEVGDKRISKPEEIPVEHEPCTKPDYLQRNVRYNQSKTVLLDEDDGAVMMEWERPLMFKSLLQMLALVWVLLTRSYNN